MSKAKNLILDTTQINQRVNRIAYQIYEDNYQEKEIVIVGIKPNGFKVAGSIVDALKNLCKIKVTLVELTIDKNNQVSDKVKLSTDHEDLVGKSIILVDDVLNSGKTLIYAMKALLSIDTKKIRTALLVDRDHKKFPVMTDFVGMTLSTTMQEHVSVEFGKQPRVYLS